MLEKKYSDAKITGSNTKGVSVAYKLTKLNKVKPGSCEVAVFNNGRLIATVAYKFTTVGPQRTGVVNEVLANKTPIGKVTGADFEETFAIAVKAQKVYEK